MHFLSFDSRASDGKIEYVIDPLVTTFLRDRRQPFAWIGLDKIQKFKTCAGLRLFQAMSLKYGRRYDRMWKPTVGELKAVLGTRATASWSNFRTRLLHALDECNQLAPFGLDVKYVKSGRKHAVTAVEFEWYPRGCAPDSMTPIRKAAAARSKRDDATVDIWDKQTDTERGSLLVIGPEAMEAAEQQIAGTDLDIEDLERSWREAMVGRAVSDPDRNFVTWVGLKVAKRNEPNDPALRDADDQSFADFLSGG
jgi:hypothetical protein